MQIDLSSLVVSSPAPKLPKWMNGNGVALVQRGDELWWGTPHFIVRGVPPKGLYILDREVIHLDATYGPQGAPEQVEPHVRTEMGTVLLRNQFGEVKVAVDRRHLRCIQVAHGNGHLYYFYYPDLVEGTSQMIAVFERRQQAVITGDESDFLSLLEGAKEVLAPFAFVTPVLPRPAYFLTIEQRAEMMPTFSGAETFHKGGADE